MVISTPHASTLPQIHLHLMHQPYRRYTYTSCINPTADTLTHMLSISDVAFRMKCSLKTYTMWSDVYVCIEVFQSCRLKPDTDTGTDTDTDTDIDTDDRDRVIHDILETLHCYIMVTVVIFSSIVILTYCLGIVMRLCNLVRYVFINTH